MSWLHLSELGSAVPGSVYRTRCLWSVCSCILYLWQDWFSKRKWQR